MAEIFSFQMFLPALSSLLLLLLPHLCSAEWDWPEELRPPAWLFHLSPHLGISPFIGYSTNNNAPGREAWLENFVRWEHQKINGKGLSQETRLRLRGRPEPKEKPNGNL